jgi:hypothetical protein
MARSPKKSSKSSSGPLACPSCALRYSLDERFCAQCGMPLVYMGAQPLEQPASEAHARARKIYPEYTEGELVRVAGARHLSEAELIQNILLEEGVPSVLRRSGGADVPDFLAAGPRDVLVPAAGADAARDALLQADLGVAAEGAPLARPRALRLLAVVAGASLLAALVAWLLSQAAA